MTIFYHRIGQPAGRGAPIALRALAKRPAEIESRLRRGHDIHFFDRALPDVADDQCRTREGGAEGIAQSKGIDIGIAAARKEGIARRGRIAVAARADREAQYLAEPRTRSEEHTSELQSLMRISYAVFCLQKKQQQKKN